MQPNFTTLHVSTCASSGVATVTLAHGKGNAMSAHFFDECRLCFQLLARDTEVRAILLLADGKYFTVGLDLKEAASNDNLSDTDDVARRYMRQRQHLLRLQDAFSALELCPQPIIAAVHGACVGGGIDLLCCCDIRLASEQAWFTIKEVDVGLAADLGTLQRLPKVVGNDSKVRELAYTARRFGALEAKEIGFLGDVLPDREALYAAAREMAELIAAKSPVAVVGTKANLNYARDHGVAEGLAYQAAWSGAALQTEDLAKSFIASLNKEKATYSKL